MDSVYDTFYDEYGVDTLRQRYGNYTVDRELRRRQRDLEQKSVEERMFGLQLQNAKMLAGEAYQNRERVDTEAQAADVLGAISDVRDPREIVGLLRNNRKAINDPAVTSAVNNKFKEFERLREINEKAAALGGYFGDYKAAVDAGQNPEEAYTGTAVRRTEDLTRSRLEGYGISTPEDSKELEKLAVKAESMEPDPALRQSLVADKKTFNEVLQDPMATDEDKAAAVANLERVNRQLMGARALGEDQVAQEKRAFINRALGR